MRPSLLINCRLWEEPHVEDPDEHTIYLRSRPDKTYVGPSFTTLNGLRMRIASKYIDGGESYEFATVKDEIVLRSTPARPIPDKGDLCRG
jgi:hypothetical protein